MTKDRTTRHLILVAAVVSGMSLPAARAMPQAQPGPTFEAASVKRNTSGGAFASPRFQGTTFTARNVAVEMLISVAYGIASREMIDAPSWIILSNVGERYDVSAKFAEGSSREDQRAMLRRLLEERFALRLRREKREMPVYLLSKLDERGELGPNLRRTVRDCLPREICSGSTGLGKTAFQGAQWSGVLSAIALPLDRRLIDRTGLSGTFDVELTYHRSLSANPDDTGVDIFTAVRQQLGLKLEPGRAPFEVGVIESINRPTPD